jgi:hypothetical protein
VLRRQQSTGGSNPADWNSYPAPLVLLGKAPCGTGTGHTLAVNR